VAQEAFSLPQVGMVVGLERVERSLEMSAYLYERRLELDVCLGVLDRGPLAASRRPGRPAWLVGAHDLYWDDSSGL
jgi:hypothetical protein